MSLSMSLFICFWWFCLLFLWIHGIGVEALGAFYLTFLPCTATISSWDACGRFPIFFIVGITVRRAVLWLALWGFLHFKQNKMRSRGFSFYGGFFCAWG